jgi:hypothetical protein
MLRTNY